MVWKNCGIDTETGKLLVWKVGRVVYIVFCSTVTGLTYQTSVTITTLPAGYRPAVAVCTPCAFGDSTMGMVAVDFDGSVRIQRVGGTSGISYTQSTFFTVVFFAA